MLFRLSATMAAFVAFTASAQDSQPFVGAHGAMTPGTYTGVTGGRSEHLDLWPDQSFHFISGDEVHAGRWHADPERNGLVLDLGGETRVLEVRNSQRLRPSGAPEDGSGDLEASEMPAPVSIRLPLSGMLTYFADAATIVHCATGRTYPVAQDGEYLALERAYLAGRSGPAEPLFVTMDALIEPRAQMEGPERLTVVPEAFGSVFPGGDCSLGNRSLDLADAVWTITSLGDVDLDPALVSREPFLIFSDEDGTFSASVGCNQLRGGYSRSGTDLSFAEPVASTMMACPDPVDDWETAFKQALSGVVGLEIGGRVLRFLDGERTPVMRLQAVYLP